MTTAFQRHARSAAKHLHIEALPLLITPHPLNDLTSDELQKLASACYPLIIRQLTDRQTPAPDLVADYKRPAPPDPHEQGASHSGGAAP